MIPIERLTQLSFFQGLLASGLALLADTAQEVLLQSNDFIVRQHDQAQDIYLLESGAVQFLIHFEGVDDLLVGKADAPGTLLGWSAFRNPFRYTASVRCEGPCRLMKWQRQVLDELFEADLPFAYLFLERVAVTLANRIEQTRELLFDPRVVRPRKGRRR